MDFCQLLLGNRQLDLMLLYHGLLIDQIILRANWKDHMNNIQKEGLHIHPRSEETKNLWMNIEKSCNIPGDWSEATVRVNAVDDSIFDKHSPNYQMVDSVTLLCQ